MSKRRVILEEAYTGAEQVLVYRPGNKEPHFVIDGVSSDRLDKAKVAEYMYECDWTDKGSPGWITPHLRCDEFLK